MAETYDTGRGGGLSGSTMSGTSTGPSRVVGHDGPSLDINTAVVTPTDRVRWGPIIAGLFTALSTLALLSLLGVAVAGSAYDPGDSARTFGIGAGIWGAISTLIAFALGGWLAARAAAVRGTNNGVLNGAMVWAVAIPVMLYFVAGAGMRAASTAAQTGAQMAMQRSNSSNGSGDDGAITASARQGPQGNQQGQDAAGQVQSTASDVANRAQAAATPENQERVADTTARTAWATLISLLLALGAASLGGYLGARRTDRDRDHGRVATA